MTWKFWIFSKVGKELSKGSFFFFLWVSFITRVSIIPTFESQIVPKLFHVNITVEFWKKSFETWIFATIVVEIIIIWREYKQTWALKIVDGLTKHDHDIVAFGPQNYKNISKLWKCLTLVIVSWRCSKTLWQ